LDSVIAVSIVRLPFLPGVTDTNDQTYTVTATSITGFVSSGVAHICAAVPTVQTLLRFCRNGFKLDTKPSSSYAKESTYDSSAKRSYKSLQDTKSNITNPNRTLGIAQQRSKGSSRNTMDPFRLSSLTDTEENGCFMELRTMQTPTRNGTKPNEEQGGQQVLDPWTPRVEKLAPTIVRKTPEPVLDDSASNKAILHGDFCQ
jgi:hypothetical protein